MPRLRFVSFVFTVMAAAFVGGCGTPSEPAASSPAGSPSAPGQAPGTARARDAYVLLSGGGTPLSNNYSQYLQARALGDFLGRDFPPESTWVFFGVGTREGAVPVLADVRRDVKREGLVVQSWLPGPLARNRPATRESFLRALREEVLPTVRDGGTLYLFVGDHGELAGAKDKPESAITLWQLKPGRRRSGSWVTDGKEILGVAELREVLAAGLGRGRVVFCMTQCHSGGFHELGVAREMVPPRAWFSAVPAWVPKKAPGLRLPVAGFTATDEASPAAGCTPNPDPESWLGYERFMPEQLLGRDLMSGQAKGPGLRSLAEAHEAATLIDHTIDKPRATSEHYLEAWARLIETRLVTTPTLTEPARRAVANFFRAVDRGQVNASDAALQQRQAQYERFTARLIEQLPAAKPLLRTGTRSQLDAAIRSRDRTPAPGGRRGSTSELRRIWTEALRPAWKTAVLAGEVGGLQGPALEFEKRLLELEDKGRDLLLPRGQDDTPLLNEMYWASGYAEPAKLDRARAEAITLWGAQRRTFIAAWGRQSTEARIRAAAAKLNPGPVRVEEPLNSLSRQTAAERVLFYRRVLAAWEFLLAMDAQPALAELRTLIELEQTPLRRSLAAQGGDHRGKIPDPLPPPLVVPPLPILALERETATFTLAAATTLELVEKLGHANGWVCDTAQRLLVERRDPAGVTALRATAIDLRKPAVARLQALWTLEGCGGGALDGMTLTAALADPDPAVVAAAVRLSEGLLKEKSNPDLAARVIALVQSRSEPAVRLQLARTLCEINSPAADVALRDLVVRAGRQPQLAAVVVSGLAGRENGLVEALVLSPAAAAQSGEVLRYATSAILKSGEAERIERVLGIVGASVTPEWARIPMLSGVRHFLPKGPDGASSPAFLPVEPTPLLALAADPASPATLIVQPLLAQLRWPGKPGVPAMVAPLTEPEQRRYDLGRQKFAVICATCHQAEGQGLGGIAPPLVESNRVLGDPRILVRIVLNGKIGSYLMMPPLKETLDDESVAGVLTFIRRSWGHEAGPVAPDLVSEARAATADRPEPFSEADLLELAESLRR